MKNNKMSATVELVTAGGWSREVLRVQDPIFGNLVASLTIPDGVNRVYLHPEIGDVLDRSWQHFLNLTSHLSRIVTVDGRGRRGTVREAPDYDIWILCNQIAKERGCYVEAESIASETWYVSGQDLDVIYCRETTSYSDLSRLPTYLHDVYELVELVAMPQDWRLHVAVNYHTPQELRLNHYLEVGTLLQGREGAYRTVRDLLSVVSDSYPSPNLLLSPSLRKILPTALWPKVEGMDEMKALLTAIEYGMKYNMVLRYRYDKDACSEGYISATCYDSLFPFDWCGILCKDILASYKYAARMARMPYFDVGEFIGMVPTKVLRWLEGSRTKVPVSELTDLLRESSSIMSLLLEVTPRGSEDYDTIRELSILAKSLGTVSLS
jgi:hypothetical protein